MENQKQGLALYPTQGFSMEPFLLDGDELLVKEDGLAGARIGDILVYRSKTESRIIAHRLVDHSVDKKTCLVRGDASPALIDKVPIAEVIGKVVLIRRGNEIFDMKSPPYVQSLLFIKLYPSLLAFKNFLVVLLTPLIGWIQHQSWYGNAVRWLGPVEIVLIPTDNNVLRIAAKIKGRFAGSLDFEEIEYEEIKAFWISSVYVRVRYRGLGLAKKLLKEVLSKAKSTAEIDELWIGFQRENDQVRNLYYSFGFREVGNHSLRLFLADRIKESDDLAALRIERGPAPTRPR